ncbi:MAG: lytic transglycosylase domain-containing protein, partial [Duodenibacillus sp.]|nr:lytic transglycosylase domain-containing protein [Duodenibacillus sp.]
AGLAKQARQAVLAPAKWLAAQEGRPAAPELGLAAAMRLAGSDPALAAELAGKIAWNARTRPYRTALWARIARLAAMKQSPQAPAWFAEAGAALANDPNVPQRDEALLWQARSALLAGEPGGILRAVAMLPPEAAAEPRWTYWKAWALAKGGKADEARALWESVAKGAEFYNLLACDALGKDYERPEDAAWPLVLPQAKVQAMAGKPFVRRALAFYGMDRFFEGNREWNWGMRRLPPEDLPALAAAAGRLGVHHRMINTSMASGRFIGAQQYPRPYAREIDAAAKASGLPAELVFGLIRQESRFLHTVRSGVGARGLMQVMPKTAQWVARREGLKGWSAQRLNDPADNLMIGCKYLALVMERFGGDVVLSAAGYNAGPLRPKLWRSRLERPAGAAAFSENITFSETRDYVQKVAANMVQYSLQGNRPLKLSSLLRPVIPSPDTDSDLP